MLVSLGRPGSAKVPVKLDSWNISWMDTTYDCEAIVLIGVKLVYVEHIRWCKISCARRKCAVGAFEFGG